jgi:hypothetical protein
MSQAGIYISGPTPSTPVETLTGNTGGAVGPTAGNINILGGVGATVAGNPGTSTLTINISGGGLTWVTTGVGLTMSPNTGYFVTASGSQAAMLMPAVGSSTVGDIIRIVGLGTGTGGVDGGSFRITQPVGVTIEYSQFFTTTGIGGIIYSNDPNDCIELVYAGLGIWIALSTVGNLHLV